MTLFKFLAILVLSCFYLAISQAQETDLTQSPKSTYILMIKGSNDEAFLNDQKLAYRIFLEMGVPKENFRIVASLKSPTIRLIGHNHPEALAPSLLNALTLPTPLPIPTPVPHSDVQFDYDNDGKIDVNFDLSKDNIATALHELGELDRQDGVDSQIIVMLGAHGFRDSEGDGNIELVTQFTRRSFSGFELDQYLSTYLDEQTPQIVLVSACFSGAFSKYVPRAGRLLFTSAPSWGVAWMTFIDGSQHTWSLYHMLSALRGKNQLGERVDADQNEDGIVSFQEAFQYVYANRILPPRPEGTRVVIKADEPRLFCRAEDNFSPCRPGALAPIPGMQSTLPADHQELPPLFYQLIDHPEQIESFMRTLQNKRYEEFSEQEKLVFAELFKIILKQSSIR